MLLLPVLLLVAPAHGADDGPPGATVHVVQLEGNLDPILADYLVERLGRARGEGAQVVVITIDSEVSHDVDGAALAAAVRDAPVPVVAWVGGPGAAARGVARDVVSAADLAAASAPVVIEPPLATPPERADTLRSLVIALDGREVGGRRLATASVEGEEARLAAPIRFFKLDFPSRVVHAVGSPHVALFLLSAGITAVLFEVFTAGIGLAALTGALCLALAGSGLVSLPTRWWAIAIMVLAFFAYTSDLQDGRLTARTWVAGLLLAVGAGAAFAGAPAGARTEWWLLAVLVVITHAFWIFAMRVMVRARYATARISRDGLIGETGTAVTTIGPIGVVEVRRAAWRADCVGASLPEGSAVRVTGATDDTLRVTAVAGSA